MIGLKFWNEPESAAVPTYVIAIFVVRNRPVAMITTPYSDWPSIRPILGCESGWCDPIGNWFPITIEVES